MNVPAIHYVYFWFINSLMALDNFVVHFKYAISCERVGLSEDAIAVYETAMKLLPKSAEALNTYVEKQISRVKLKGPTKRSKAPGLQYIIY
jgi:hypothetical protein